ncbi:alpha-2-macroglobulin-like protein 1 [Cricetulus griseus]|nr:alpha-2-macroglobulin-like protein 1 [Cricetulus griseus]
MEGLTIQGTQKGYVIVFSHLFPLTVISVDLTSDVTDGFPDVTDGFPDVTDGFLRGKYLVTIPAQLAFPSTQKVCLDLSPGNYDVKFTITLETKDKTQKLLEHSGLNKKNFHCISFSVPPPAGGMEEVATIRVSGVGKKLRFEEEKKVLIQRQGSGTFVQTDKPVYTPGQKVLFRIVTMNSDFIPVNDKYSMVELQDPNTNRIAQWLDVAPRQGIVDLSFQLAPEATLGTYTVTVAEGKTFSTFSVEEYVLPRFKVDVLEPKQLSTRDEFFSVKICGKYTYGKPVQGAVKASVCQKAYSYWYGESDQEQPTDKCRNLSGQTDAAGCFSDSVDMSTFNLTGYMYSHSINIVASVVEEGTGLEANTTRDIYISSKMGSMTFEDTNNFYYPGFPFSGKIRVRGHDDSLLKNHPVFLVIYGKNGTTNQTLTTDNDGLAPFTLDTVSWNATDISLEGKFQLEDLVYNPEEVPHYYQNAYLYLRPFYNTTRSFLGIRRPSGLVRCGQTQEVLVDYSIDPKDASPDQEVIFSYYTSLLLEMSHQDLISGELLGPKGSFSFPLTFTSRMAPSPSLVIYTVFPSGGVIADKIQFSMEMCFDNQVSIGFSPSQQLPGTDVELQLQAAPGSLCAVRAVDESVLLLRPERELSNSSVYGMFPSWYNYYPYQVAEYDECPASGPWDFPQPLIDPVPREGLSRHSIIWRPWFSEGTDLFSFFQDMGLKILSNAKIKKPVDCSHHPPHYSTTMGGSKISGGGAPNKEFASPSPQTQGSKVRQYFPETWLWELFPIGNSGNKVVQVTVPDTITEWKAMTFCTSQSRGFGLSSTVGMSAFQPFFVDLVLPYSVVRGESFRLTATVFNYLKDPMRVQTRLAPSDEYHVDSGTDYQASSCLGANEAKTFHWNITAVKLGHVNFTISTKTVDSNELCGGRKGVVPNRGQSDTLIKPVLVKPEGILVEKTHSSLLCPKGEVASDSVSLELPEDTVPDSAKAHITALGKQLAWKGQGDIMGTALQHLDGLVQMPSGCGEQNMVIFAPIIYVLQYLEKTGLLTEEIRSRAVGFLEKGYQQELMYKHSNGSYSAFGEQDGNGNTWLTAFVTKCFGQAQKFIFIDDKNIQDALKWMAGNQLPSGCYDNVGKLLHTAMKGGVDDEISLTAYITAALLEMGKTVNDPMVRQGLQCLRKSVTSTSNLYTQALLAYTFSLAGDMEIRSALLRKLDQQATVSGESIHWSQKPAVSDTSPWSEPKAVDIELTAYVLLAHLIKDSLTQEEIAKATSIVAWLAKQRNAYGGFSSTQDTVVALQALAKFAAIAYVPSEEVSVLLQQPLVKKVESGKDTLNIYLEELNKKTQTYTLTISQSVLVTNLKPATIKVYDYYLLVRVLGPSHMGLKKATEENLKQNHERNEKHNGSNKSGQPP